MKKENAIVVCGQKVAVEFVVNEEKKTVVALAKNCEELGIAACDPAFRSIQFMELAPGSRLEKNMYMSPTYSGVARCYAEDTFDLAVGKAVALAKLHHKLASAIYSRKLMFANELGRMIDSLVGGE